MSGKNKTASPTAKAGVSPSPTTANDIVYRKEGGRGNRERRNGTRGATKSVTEKKRERRTTGRRKSAREKERKGVSFER